MDAVDKIAPRMRQHADREPLTGSETLQGAAMGTMFIPGIGDATGLAADVDMYLNDPASRTWMNYLFTAAGILPVVPALAVVKNKAQKIKAYHGSPHDFDQPPRMRQLFRGVRREEDTVGGDWWTPDQDAAGEYGDIVVDGGIPDSAKILDVEDAEEVFIEAGLEDVYRKYPDDYPNTYDALDSAEVRNALKAQGYDVIRFDDMTPEFNTEHETYLILNADLLSRN